MSQLTLTSSVKLSTGYTIPLLGFGVYKNYNAEPSIVEAFKAGYRHVDSAQVYRNEAAVGDAVKATMKATGLERKDFFITTKCLGSPRDKPERTLLGVDESLSNFGFSHDLHPETKKSDNYIDLFLIHAPMPGPEQRLKIYEDLQDCRKEDEHGNAKIRTVGVSNYGVRHLEELKNAHLPVPAVNQIELHPFCQQKPIVAYCRENSIVIQAYTPLIQGRMDHPVIHQVAQKHEREPAQILLRWSLQKGYVSASPISQKALIIPAGTTSFIPLPKSATPERIRSNANLYDFALDEDDMAQLDGLDRGKEGAVTWNPVDFP